ncbi:hypothetical protein ACTXT7_000557 [Hymenolepis weldensis]
MFAKALSSPMRLPSVDDVEHPCKLFLFFTHPPNVVGALIFSQSKNAIFSKINALAKIIENHH